MQREADVPFRVGHHFASELVNFGRAHDLKPSDIPYAEAQRIYAEAAGAFKLDATTKLPLSEAAFRRALTAENMVAASQGLGGPQPAEVARMMAGQSQPACRRTAAGSDDQAPQTEGCVREPSTPRSAALRSQ